MRAITFLMFSLMLLMLSLNLEVEGSCSPNGCSIPFNLPFFYKRRFTPACNKHDVCYACGADNGWSRSFCDDAFRSDMKSLCRSLGAVKKMICKGFANDYYYAVRRFGKNHYKTDLSLWWCSSCRQGDGDPHRLLTG